MAKRSRTAEMITEAARLHFNQKGYAATTVTEIAASIGISQGNLTYHFPTKRDLVTRMQEMVAERILNHRAEESTGAIEDDFVAHLSFATELTATYLFLLRDDAQIEPGPDHQTPHRVLVNHYEAQRQLLERVAADELFRTDLDIDLDELARSLWLVSRYWVEYLLEMELRADINPADQRRGLEQYFAVLIPHLNAAGRRRFTNAMSHSSADAIHID